MARDRKPPEPREDVPKWFMTYSDVITLLMTFFILLLTFATNEPERFEKMKISMFGGTGSSGIAGQKTTGVDQDSLVVRVRPKSSRQAERGAEMPPVEKDAAEYALQKGLAGLEEDELKFQTKLVAITLPINQLADRRGQLYEYGQKTLGMIGHLARQRPFSVNFQTNNRQHVERLVAFVDYLQQQQGIELGRVGVQYMHDAPGDPHNVTVVLQIIDGTTHVSETKETTQ